MMNVGHATAMDVSDIWKGVGVYLPHCDEGKVV